MANPDSPRKRFSGLLFDLDGTLLDSFSVHLEAYQVMFALFGIQMTEEKFLASYCPNWYQTYEAFGLPREVWETANSYWLEAAEQRVPELIPGAKETLAQLHGSYQLGIVTSGSRHRVWRDLERTGIKSLFQTVVTGDDVQRPKPFPEGLELALRQLGRQPNEVAYIGDAQADYEMAQAAQVYFLGIPSAFASLTLEHPCRQVTVITDLLKVFGLE
jgi:HAD superfamily hydrolase (TIGR01509 family)